MLKQRLNSLILTEQDKAEIKDFYLEYHENTIEPFTYIQFSEFSRTGKRIGYETLYFNRRRRISSTFMMLFAFGEDYLDELCELLMAVCDEHTWALPAHVKNYDTARFEIDLFAAETAMMLSEISYLLSDTLPDTLKDRISFEIKDRIFNTFNNKTFHWETARHNWSAVCCGCIGMTYLYLCPDKLPTARILSAMECYLSGCGDDGVCLEGLGYWSYGFGFYIYFAALLKERTGIDIINKDKVLDLARFQQIMYLSSEAISCSDSTKDTLPLSGLTGMLCELFPEYVYSPASVQTERNDNCGRWAHYIRSYLFTPNYQNECCGEFIYNSSQWYINKKTNYSLFIKGGNNAEPHNHNDIGSFIISDSNGQILCDIGCGEYTDDYFAPETRYNHLCNSSFGHSVPIIDGNGQQHGVSYRCDKFECGGNRVLLSIGQAYDSNISIIREIQLSENEVILCDTFSPGHAVKERFVTLKEPEIKENNTLIGNFCINLAADVSTQIISDHNGKPLTVYLLGFNVSGNVFKIYFREVSK